MKLKANAKINLSLKVCGKRADGYHLIDTVMHSVSLFDELEIEKAEKISVICSSSQISGESNIAYRAAERFFEYTGIRGGTRIFINKHIPTAAGLGGGSADAAAVLKALNILYCADLSDNDLRGLAVGLGADVPFFISGGCARGEGIGEALTDYPPLKEGWLLLAKGDNKPSTAEMYKKIDGAKPIDVDTQNVLAFTESNNLPLLAKYLKNAFAEVWDESIVKKLLFETEPLAVSLSGSGPTWFALFEAEPEAKRALEYISKHKIDCWLTTPANSAIIFE